MVSREELCRELDQDKDGAEKKPRGLLIRETANKEKRPRDQDRELNKAYNDSHECQ